MISASPDDDTVGLYLNDGSGNFTMDAIDTAADGAYGVFTIDVDRDGDVDVLSASRDSAEVAVHEQQRRHDVTVAPGGTLSLIHISEPTRH